MCGRYGALSLNRQVGWRRILSGAKIEIKNSGLKLNGKAH